MKAEWKLKRFLENEVKAWWKVREASLNFHYLQMKKVVWIGIIFNPQDETFILFNVGLLSYFIEFGKGTKSLRSFIPTGAHLGRFFGRTNSAVRLQFLYPSGKIYIFQGAAESPYSSRWKPLMVNSAQIFPLFKRTNLIIRYVSK